MEISLIVEVSYCECVLNVCDKPKGQLGMQIVFKPKQINTKRLEVRPRRISLGSLS
jgi:hypothetical protein